MGHINKMGIEKKAITKDDAYIAMTAIIEIAKLVDRYNKVKAAFTPRLIEKLNKVGDFGKIVECYARKSDDDKFIEFVGEQNLVALDVIWEERKEMSQETKLSVLICLRHIYFVELMLNVKEARKRTREKTSVNALTKQLEKLNQLLGNIIQLPRTQRGRKNKRFSEYICQMVDNKETFIDYLKKHLAGKKGKEVARAMKACMKLKIINKPSFKSVEEEFGKIGNQSGFYSYMNENYIFSEDEMNVETEEIKEILSKCGRI